MAFTTTEFEQIYRRCFARAMGLAVSMLHDDEDARDVVQEVFARLWQASQTVDNPDAFIFRAVRNACFNQIEATATYERVKRLLPLASSIATSDDTIEQRAAAVRKAVATLLTERESEVVELIFTHKRTYKEAAQELDLSVSAINKHVVNALRKLRNHFNSRTQ